MPRLALPRGPVSLVLPRRRRGRAPLVAGVLGAGLLLGLIILAVGAIQQAAVCSTPAQQTTQAAVAGVNQPTPTAFARRDIPPKALALYQAAGARYAIDWSVIAGIGWAECSHGRNRDPSCWREGQTNSAGAGGPMQFLASTWATYGVDANHDGRKDRWNQADAIYAAANYLQHSGAPGDYRQAVFAYNHADWYVNEVLARAQRYSGAPPVTATTPTPAATTSPTPTPTPSPAGPPAPPTSPQDPFGVGNGPGAPPPPTLTAANFHSPDRFSFQSLTDPTVAAGWGATGWLSNFNDHTTASGIPADGTYPGISFWHGPTVRGYWEVSFPNHKTLVLRQIDTGPNTSLTRLVDIDYAAVVKAGYSIGSFPTGGYTADPRAMATTVYLGQDHRWEALNGQVLDASTQAPASGSAGCAAAAQGPAGGLGNTPTVPGSKVVILPSGTAAAPQDAPAAVGQMVAAADRINHFTYSYGGGHGGNVAQTMNQTHPDVSSAPGQQEWGGPGYDCSASTSYVLFGAGLGQSVLHGSVPNSGDMAAMGDPGPGRWVTWHANANHVFIEIAGAYFDTGAGGRPPNPPDHGPRWVSSDIEGSGYVLRHPPGL